MLIDDDKLSKLSNKYILKSIFYHLNYNRLLKLFKYNKSIQNKAGITLDNYKLQFNYPQYHYFEYFSDDFYSLDPEFNGEAKLGQFCLLLCFIALYFIYVSIYSLLLLIKDTFNDTTAQGNYKNKAHIIKKISACNFILLVANIIGVILLFYYEYHSSNISFKKGIKMMTKNILIILYDLLFLSYEGIIIWKLVLSYQIKKEGAFWFIVMDYVFIFLNLLYIALLFYLSYIFFKSYRKFKNADENYVDYFIDYLSGIRIDNYKVSQDFINMDQLGKKQFLLNNYKNMKYINSNEQIRLIGLINEFREKNNLNKFSFDKFKNVPGCFMKKYTEVEINKEENVFKLSNKLYLFKFSDGEFENKLKNNDIDSDMLNALTNEELNHVKIINKNNFEYIFFCKLSSAQFFEHVK